MPEFLDELKLLGLGEPWSGNEKAGYWELVARRAVIRFARKDKFMRWVDRTYSSEENRFAASVCWDIIKLKLAQEQEKQQ